MSEDDFIRGLYEDMQTSTAGLARARVPRSKRFRAFSSTTAEEQGVSSAIQPEENEAWRPPPGVARSRTGTRWREPQRISELISGMSNRPGWKESLDMGTVVARWPEIVGPQVAQHCVVISFDDNKLHVRSDSTAWAKQLQLLLPQIERRISETVGDGYAPQVIVHGPQAPSWRHGPYSPKGRGPRDTYG